MSKISKILLGLKCCEDSGHVCRVCPYCISYEDDESGFPIVECHCETLHQDAQKLINRQQEEIKQLMQQIDEDRIRRALGADHVEVDND